jgi:putative peptidoglycan lipid II flippase
MTSVTTSGGEQVSAQSTRRLAGATGIMMAAIFASRILGLVRDAVISGRFGQSQQSDVYYAAFLIPDLLFFLIAGGALSSAFIPVFTEKITQGKEEEAWQVFSTVCCVMFVAVSIFVIIGEIYTRQLVGLMNFGFTREKVMMAVPLTRVVLPAQICFFIGGLLMGTQYARNQFLIPALGPIVYNIGIIFGGVVLANWLGVAGLCWGALAGAIVGNFFLQLWAVYRSGMQFHISFNWRHPDVMKVWKLMLPVVLGLALPQVSIVINKMFASCLGNGPQSALTRANMLMQVPLGIFAQAMAVAIFPTLAVHAANKRLDLLKYTSSLGIRSILFLTIPSSVFMIILARPLVQLLLQHGKFTSQDTVMTATALCFYAIGIFAWSAQSILARGFYAMQDTITPVVIGTAVTLIFIPMNWLFMTPFHLSFSGLALATTIAAIMHMTVMMGVLRKRLHGFDGKRMLLSVIKIIFASAIAGAVCWIIRLKLDNHFHPLTTIHHVKIDAAITLLVGGGIGCLVYIILAVIFKMEELNIAKAILKRKKLPAIS